jgi:hypothetical protein
MHGEEVYFPVVGGRESTLLYLGNSVIETSNFYFLFCLGYGHAFCIQYIFLQIYSAAVVSTVYNEVNKM